MLLSLDPLNPEVGAPSAYGIPIDLSEAKNKMKRQIVYDSHKQI